MTQAQEDLGKEADSTRLAVALSRLMSSLSETMEVEIEYLDRHDIASIESLRETKARLARDYQNNVTLVEGRPELLRGASEALREELRQESVRLDAVTRRNAAAIKAAIGATQTLIETVVDAARREIKKTDAYSDPRKMTNILGSYSPLCTPVAVNRTA